MRRAQGVVLFLVRFNNSARFEIYEVARSSSSRPFLCALAAYIYLCNTYSVWALNGSSDASNYNGIISTQDSHKTAHAIGMSRINTADSPQQKADTKLFSSRESTFGHKTNQWVGGHRFM